MKNNTLSSSFFCRPEKVKAILRNLVAFQIVLFLFSGFQLPKVIAQTCAIPAPASVCTPPTVFDESVNIPGNTTVFWTNILNAPPADIVTRIRISGSGKVIVQNSDLILKSTTAVLYLEGVELVVDNGNLKLDVSGSRLIMNGGTLRTAFNLEQVGNTTQCFSNAVLEIGDEQIGGTFNAGNALNTSGSWTNDGGYRYVTSSCTNVTSDMELSSSGTGTGTSGVDILVNSCFEIGDAGPVNAIDTQMGVADGDDSGNWLNDNRQQIYNSQITGANGDFSNSGIMTLCDVSVRFNKSGNFTNQSGATMNGQNLCMATEDAFLNDGTWTLSVDAWFSDLNDNTNVPNAGPETAEATILANCFSSTCCDAALPVDFLDFKGKFMQEAVHLFWITGGEYNNADFVIEKSLDTKNWKKIGLVKGAGISSEDRHYEFKDNQPAKGVNYYRLKQMDFDGAFSYSTVISVSTKLSKQEVLIFPNPVQDGVLNLTTPVAETTIRIFDASGRMIKEEVLTSGQVSITIENLSSGLYLLQTQVEGQVFSQVFVVE